VDGKPLKDHRKRGPKKRQKIKRAVAIRCQVWNSEEELKKGVRSSYSDNKKNIRKRRQKKRQVKES